MTNDSKHDSRDFDGILEEDNPMPRWWVRLFQASVVFAVAYMAWYHLPWFPSVSQEEEFQRGLEALTGKPGDKPAQAAAGANTSLPERAKDAASVTRGQVLFATNCASCHGADGGGVVGPNLADAAWMHGRTAPALEKVIGEGVPAKGMPAWGSILGAAKIIDLTAYIASLQGTKPATPKPPQGEEGDLQ